jgi:hypothetical protein
MVEVSDLLLRQCGLGIEIPHIESVLDIVFDTRPALVMTRIVPGMSPFRGLRAVPRLGTARNFFFTLSKRRDSRIFQAQDRAIDDFT